MYICEPRFLGRVKEGVSKKYSFYFPDVYTRELRQMINRRFTSPHSRVFARDLHTVHYE